MKLEVNDKIKSLARYLFMIPQFYHKRSKLVAEKGVAGLRLDYSEKEIKIEERRYNSETMCSSAGLEQFC